jgi:hypothetical protein
VWHRRVRQAESVKMHPWVTICVARGRKQAGRAINFMPARAGCAIKYARIVPEGAIVVYGEQADSGIGL